MKPTPGTDGCSNIGEKKPAVWARLGKLALLAAAAVLSVGAAFAIERTAAEIDLADGVSLAGLKTTAEPGPSYREATEAEYAPALAGAIDRLSEVAGVSGERLSASLERFAGNISLLPPDAAMADLAVVSGATSFNFLQASMEAGLSLSKTVFSRSNSVLREMKAEAEKYGAGSAFSSQNINDRSANRFWVETFGVGVERGDVGGLPGYAYNYSGAAVGYDRVAGNFFGGVGFAYLPGTLDNRTVNDNNTLESYNLGLYGGYRHSSGFFSKIFGGYGRGENSFSEYLNSVGGWRRGNSSTDTLMLGNVVGVDMPVGGMTLSPSFGLIRQDAFGSPYATSGAINQRFGRTHASSLAVPLDLAISYVAKRDAASSITLTLNGGYSRELDGQRPTGTMSFTDAGANPMEIMGMNPNRDAAYIGGGATYRYKYFDFGATYRYDGDNDYDRHFLGGNIGITF